MAWLVSFTALGKKLDEWLASAKPWKVITAATVYTFLTYATLLLLVWLLLRGK